MLAIISTVTSLFASLSDLSAGDDFQKKIKAFCACAEKTGKALVKSANFTREFFRIFPEAVGNIEKTQEIVSFLPGFGPFAERKENGKFRRTIAGLDNALRKTKKAVVSGDGTTVIWQDNEYSYNLCLVAISLDNAARKQAAKNPNGASKVDKKTPRADIASLMNELVALCDEYSDISKDARYGRIIDKWLDMEV